MLSVVAIVTFATLCGACLVSYSYGKLVGVRQCRLALFGPQSKPTKKKG